MLTLTAEPADATGPAIGSSVPQPGQPAEPVSRGPVLAGPDDPIELPGGDEIGADVGQVGRIDTTNPLAQPSVIDPQAAQAGEPVLRVGLPAGVTAEYTMPGTGAPPAAGDDRARKLAAFQAAVFTAIYNVTKELNPHSYKDPIEDGFIDSDHFRYKTGLEVKSQTVVVRGRVKQFDIWLIVSAGIAGPPPGSLPPPLTTQPSLEKLEVHLRNFALAGAPLNQEKLDRVLRAGGGHLVVIRVDGPDDRGLYTAEVGLVRKAPKSKTP